MSEEKKIKIYMGIPSTGDRMDLHTYLFRDLQERYGDRIQMVFPELCIHRTFHDRARNDIVEEFLASDCDVLWFLDSDVCPPAHIFDIFAKYEEWQVAGAPYPIFMPTPGTGEMSILFTVYKGVLEDAAQRGIYMSETPQSGAEYVDALATGCLFIKREVFSKLKKPYFEFKFDPETRAIKEGEDLGFALKLHDLGIKFYCDYGMVCKHYKKLCLLDMNNYAISVSNYRVLEYDKQIRGTIQEAINAATKAGYERGVKDAQKSAQMLPKKSESGLILPSNYTR